MKKFYIIVAVIIILFALNSSNVYPDSINNNWIITPGVGIDWIKVGAQAKPVLDALGNDYDAVVGLGENDGSNVGCKFNEYGIIIYVNKKKKTIWAIDIFKSGYKKTMYQTSNGIHVGTHRTTLLQKYRPETDLGECIFFSGMVTEMESDCIKTIRIIRK
jgi:hypothetical protein